MDPIEMFVFRHERLHRHLETLTDDLTEAEIRTSPHPAVNPLAWLLWHVARSEDGAIGLLVCDAPQVLNRDWSARLNITRTDAGTGMTMADVLDLSASVDLSALAAYRRAVAEQTMRLVGSLKSDDLDVLVGADKVRRAFSATVSGPLALRLSEMWQETPRGHFLVWLALTHSYEHVGQADLIRGLLGRPGRF